MNGDRTIGFEPELEMEHEEGITGFDVLCHDWVRVRHCTCYFLYDDVIAFERGVGLVCW